MKIGQNELKKTLCPPHQQNSTSRGSWKGFEKDGVQNEKERYAIIAQLKEFQLQAEKHLCRIPVIDQTYIYTEGHLLIFQWKKKKKERKNTHQFHSWIDRGWQGIYEVGCETLGGTLTVVTCISQWYLPSSPNTREVSSLPLWIWRSHNKHYPVRVSA